jgi:hypothetical protein
MSDYTEAEALHAEINRLVAVEKTLEEEFWALPEGSAAAASTARAACQIGDQIRRLEVELWAVGCHRPLEQTLKSDRAWSICRNVSERSFGMRTFWRQSIAQS